MIVRLKLCVLFLVAILASCSLFTPAKVDATKKAGIDASLCVLGELAKGDEDPVAIATACGIELVDDVVAIIRAHKAAMESERARTMTTHPHPSPSDHGTVTP